MSESRSSGRHPDVGVVVIGRNEGERLRRCLESVRDAARAIVYVDSGSTDGSVALAAGARRDRGRARHAPAVHRRPRPQRGPAPLAGDRARPGRSSSSSTATARWSPGWLPLARALSRSRAAGRRRLRPTPRALPGAIGLQPAVRPRVEHADRRSPGLRRRRDDAHRGLAPGRRLPRRPDRRRGARALRPPARRGLEDLAPRRRDDAARRRHDPLRPVVAAHRRAPASPTPRGCACTARRRSGTGCGSARSAWLWGAVLPLADRPCLRSRRRPGRLLGIRDLSAAGAAARAGGCAPRSAARWARAFFLVLGKFPEAQGRGKRWLLHRRRRQAVLIEYK